MAIAPRADKPGLKARVSVAAAATFKAIKVLVVLGLLVAGGAGAVHLYNRYDVPIAVIGVEGELNHVTAGEVESIVADNLGGGFLSLDLEGICVALKDHPWVAAASARRKWPDQVIISLEEEVPIARWGSDDFLNNKGEILNVGDIALSKSLPLLDGPAGEERRVMQQYRNFSQMLQGTGLKIGELKLAPRGNWEVAFTQGLELVVGKEPVGAKLKRFMLVWDQALEERVDAIERVDVRYGNGVAVNWKQGNNAAITTESES